MKMNNEAKLGSSELCETNAELCEPRYRARFNERWTPEPNSGCWLWTAWINPDGYGAMWIQSEKRSVQAQRLSWEFNRGAIPSGMCVLHKCDIRSCVNPRHLFLGTLSENTKDRDRKGRQAYGERSGIAKLTNEDVKLIRSSQLSGSEMARRLGVSKAEVSKIRSGKLWKHVESNKEDIGVVGITETLQYLMDRNRPRFNIIPNEKEDQCAM